MQDKIWAGRFEKSLDSAANDFNSSIRVDKRMYREDIEGSKAHAAMLGSVGIITAKESELIVGTLDMMLKELETGDLEIDETYEDIHSFMEAELTRRIGDTGKKLHTARSRNDQVATDVRLYLRRRIDAVTGLLVKAVETMAEIAGEHAETIMPGYTHLQRAQPVSFGHVLMAYAHMLLRDISRFADCRKRMNVSPLGSCALAGTTFPIDRFATASALGFDRPCGNSIDGVSDRDFAVELAACCAICAMHLSRLCEEIIMYCSWEFGYLELDDSFSTGSSIMPQKKNPDIAELIRGKSGRIYGDLTALLTMLKSLPLAYNKDMQEDKEAVFDSIDTLCAQLSLIPPMLRSAAVRSDRMRRAAAEGFINATDMADYLVAKGLPFRAAYKISGTIVAYCIKERKTLETLSPEEYRSFSELFGDDIYEAVSLDRCLAQRRSFGGTAPECVKAQIEAVRAELKEMQ